MSNRSRCLPACAQTGVLVARNPRRNWSTPISRQARTNTSSLAVRLRRSARQQRELQRCWPMIMASTFRWSTMMMTMAPVISNACADRTRLPTNRVRPRSLISLASRRLNLNLRIVRIDRNQLWSTLAQVLRRRPLPL